ncbi:hypothetical protein ACSBR2_035806 [Camellia fascicularis]
MHLANSTMNRVESSHAKLKRCLGSSQGSFQSNWSRIHHLHLQELQHTDIKSLFEKSKTVVQHNSKSAQFKDLRGNVSIIALEMILAESKRASFVGIDIVTCGCVVRRTHGLPCVHKIADYMRENQPIRLTSVDPHWSKLDMLNTPKKSNSFLDCKSELDMFARRYEEVDRTMQVQMLKKLREIHTPESTFLIEPEVKLNLQGRPSLKIDTSTRREPSAFEFVPFAHDSYSPSVYPHRSTKKTNLSFVCEFPSSLRPYIQLVKNVDADGDCGFRTIAGLIRFGED